MIKTMNARLKVIRIVTPASGKSAYEVEYEGNRRLVKLFSFQHSLPVPDEIDCVITTNPTGKIEIKQDITPYVQQRYHVGGKYDFIVRNDYTRTNRYYELCDDRGFYFKLYTKATSGASLLVGQHVTCKVTAITCYQMQLSLVGAPDIPDSEEEEVPEVSYASPADAQTITPDFIEKYLLESFDSDEQDARSSTALLLNLIFANFEDYSASVSQSLLQAIHEKEGIYTRPEIIRRLSDLRHAVLHVLEESDCLLLTDSSQRETFRNRLACLATLLTAYISALQAFEDGKVEEHLDRLLSNLQKSGYIYRASERFDFMQRVFSIDHDIIQGYMGRIFSIIHERDCKFWSNEPFRTAFIRLLELFINDACQRLDLATGDEDRRVTPVIEALAIQLKLANRTSDSEILDFNLNLAMLYRLTSHLRTSIQRRALRNAYRSLLDLDRGVMDFNWNDSHHHDLLASKISSMSISALEMENTKTYEAKGVRLSIRDSEIMLRPSGLTEEEGINVMPDSLSTWIPVRILADSNFRMPERLRRRQPETKNLAAYTTLWSDIEKSLFYPDPVRKPKKRAPMIGDSCMIRVSDEGGDQRWHCIIEEEDIEGEGFIHTSEIVPYKADLYLEDFSANGRQLVFEAQVINIDADGLCRFSMKRAGFDFLTGSECDEFRYDKPIECLLTVQDRTRPGYWLGIASNGIGVSIAAPDNMTFLQGGDMVVANHWEPGKALTMQGEIESILPHDTTPLTAEEAVRNLLQFYAGDAYTVRDDEVLDAEEMLDRRRLEELINIIDRVASLEKNHIAAYNYLGLARTLSMLADDEERYDFYQGWMKLIAILHHFTVNGKIDPRDLKAFEDKNNRFDPQSELQRRFLQLKIVSLRGNPDSRDILWEHTRSSDEVIRALAENVLAFNLISPDAPDSVRNGIDEKIYQLLNVHKFNSSLHIMEEDEGPTVEYKTSLVYPSDNHMRADIAVQTGEILKGVCAMLNARGGVIYVGVNNYHAVTGIENDLSYKDFKGDADKYDNAFRNALRLAFGNDVDAYVETKLTVYREKQVYEIHIRPYFTEPVRYQKVIYERHGASKIALTGEDERRFIQRRLQEKGEPEPVVLSPADTSNDEQPEILSPEQDYESATDYVLPSPISSGKVFDEDRVHSGAAHPANRCDREANPSIVRYIQILKDHYRLLEYVYDWNDDKVCLTLPVLENQEDHYLVMAYSGGAVCRVPLKHILDKRDWQEYVRYRGEQLLFAEIAPKEAALMSIGINKKGQERIRIDSLEKICEVTNPSNKGQCMVNAPLDSYTIFDIVPQEALQSLSGLLDLPSSDTGKLLRRLDSDKNYRILSNLGLLS